MKHLVAALAIIIVGAQLVIAQPALPDEAKVYVGAFSFRTNTTSGKFWISADGAGLKVDRFSYRDARGERDLPDVTIVKAEQGAGYTIAGRSWKIRNLVPAQGGKVLDGTFEQGPIQNRLLYWRE
jgi:hypothetical protein